MSKRITDPALELRYGKREAARRLRVQREAQVTEIRLYAKTTDQGTAADEAVICSDCDTPERRVELENQAQPDVTGPWEDATENEAICCQFCGR